ncbi:MAG TPA: hypothetical protein VJ654_12920 [Noviherbaspirillum sp.]|nr:hypothetical protein [Noviherbaspirillum sp.]
MRQFNTKAIASAVTTIFTSSALLGCSTLQPEIKRIEDDATQRIAVEREKATPIVTTTADSWLLGETVQVKPAASPLLSKFVTYHPATRVTLADIANYISQETGLIVDTSEMQYDPALAPSAAGAPGAAPSAMSTNAPTVPAISAVAGGASFKQYTASQSSVLPTMFINYAGAVSGLMDVAANNAGGWWKFADGRLMFYRTESKTFYVPAIARKSKNKSTISANAGSGDGASSDANTNGGTSSSAANSSSDYDVDVWAELEKTAKAVGLGAIVVGNMSVGSITVMGTPAQVRNVEEWVNSLSHNLSQQVALTVNVYKVKISNESNYNWNPTLIFNNAAARYGVALTGPDAPPVISGANPLNLTASVLSTATGKAAEFTGSKMAYQALSTLGRVSETFHQTVLTLNGQPAPMQIANQLSYLKSSQTNVSQGAGATTSLQPGTVTTGFTAMFVPRIVNGKIYLTMNLTSSNLLSLGSVSSGGATIQTPNIDISTFQQSVSLTPGDSLMLTGLQQDKGTSNQNGVGSPNNYMLGGGFDNTTGKQLIAIVISAKVL